MKLILIIGNAVTPCNKALTLADIIKRYIDKLEFGVKLDTTIKTE